MGWKDSSTVKNTNCSFRGSRPDPPRPHDGSQPSTSKRVQLPLLACMDTAYMWYTDMYIGKTSQIKVNKSQCMFTFFCKWTPSSELCFPEPASLWIGAAAEPFCLPGANCCSCKGVLWVLPFILLSLASPAGKQVSGPKPSTPSEPDGIPVSLLSLDMTRAEHSWDFSSRHSRLCCPSLRTCLYHSLYFLSPHL